MQKVGILGGGQLGRMLLQAAANYPVETHVLENDDACPAAHLCRYFVKGDIRDFDAVYNFGKSLDAITIEIENVNIDALEKLEQEGIKVYPRTSVLRLIKNKARQKKYYTDHQIPTAAYAILQSATEIADHSHLLPAVHKSAEGGYDGRGVQPIDALADAVNGFNEESVLEKKVVIKKEIAQIVAVDEAGKMVLYPPVEMVFNQSLNLLDYQLCPADIPQNVLWKVEAIALAVVRNFHSPGLFAVELFVDAADDVLVNETAPRVHNSGHHTIEAHYSSQFDMLWRIILGYPLGNTKKILSSVMVNIIGSEGHTGTPVYEGLEEVLQIDNAFVHLYGKLQTKPGRKMGHVTVLSNEKQDLIHKANKIRQTLKVITK
ncbi:5-(carboxyamino)imidazole ribonucleotide synthase [Flavisolibacter nicotianae]|uniref:5-(carboxyamino)imidazole ribonucleotide synthase n=1 Tax=Flavisolibacter nicotianae TaxID=2364882 RepID=UPI000EABAD61|nr:5-(carboxyamino)imidazole ribonucleotide synthase [Flavisolibacter nicotianae]